MKTTVGHYNAAAAKYHKPQSESIKVDSMQSTNVQQQQDSHLKERITYWDHHMVTHLVVVKNTVKWVIITPYRDTFNIKKAKQMVISALKQNDNICPGLMDICLLSHNVS